MDKNLLTSLNDEVKKSLLLLQDKLKIRVKKECDLIDKFGAVKIIDDFVKKDSFPYDLQDLDKTKILSSSVEAIVIKSKFANLFADDTVNCCYERLCEFEYFTKYSK